MLPKAVAWNGKEVLGFAIVNEGRLVFLGFRGQPPELGEELLGADYMKAI